MIEMRTLLEASRAISSEIAPEKLQLTVLKLALEYVGAQSGFLILDREEQLEIAAFVDGGDEQVLQSIPLEGNGMVAESIVRHVDRTGQGVVLDDAARQGSFVQDPFVVERQSRSILCLPIRHRDRSAGVLYLENDLTTAAFPADCVELLETLLAQAAISLENARLYDDLRQELERVRTELVRGERLSALGQLTATVAHEIRNPLGTVRAAVFAIGDAIARDELHRVERAQRLAERNIVRCDSIIRELLDYVRERPLNLDLVYVDTWLDVLLDEQAVLKDESIVCVRELNSGVRVPLDRDSFQRAVINVVDNGVEALKGEASRGNQLTVSTRVSGDRFEIRVSDTGCGIPGDVMDRIFEPLFSTKTSGVGLGLSIVKNIMQQHGGGIEIQSQAGEGSTVTLWLPLESD